MPKHIISRHPLYCLSDLKYLFLSNNAFFSFQNKKAVSGSQRSDLERTVEQDNPVCSLTKKKKLSMNKNS
jgi:hypothetical protein